MSRELLDQAAGRLATRMEPRVEAEFCTLLGDLSAAVGEHQKAEAMHQRALDLYRRLLGKEDPKTVLAFESVAADLVQQQRLGEAESLYYSALAMRRRLF